MSQAVKDCIAVLADSARPDPARMQAAFDEIMSGEADEAQIAAMLMGLRLIGETADEIAAGARVLRGHASSIETPHDVVDTCGTGGDAAGSYNVSTAAAIIAAGAGAKVAKHGNRAVSSLSGSSQVLAELGVNIEADHETVARCIGEAGVGFLYAPSHHSAMRHAAPVRRSLALRTIFNLLGPLTNPAGAKRQVLGVYDARWLEPMAETLRRLGSTHVWVVHGGDGMDELTTTTTSEVVELKDGALKRFTLDPEGLGLAKAEPQALKGGDPAHNAAAVKAVIEGEANAYCDIAVLNAGAALLVAGNAETIEAGIALAAESLDSGAAKHALARLIEISQG